MSTIEGRQLPTTDRWVVDTIILGFGAYLTAVSHGGAMPSPWSLALQGAVRRSKAKHVGRSLGYGAASLGSTLASFPLAAVPLDLLDVSRFPAMGAAVRPCTS